MAPHPPKGSRLIVPRHERKKTITSSYICKVYISKFLPKNTKKRKWIPLAASEREEEGGVVYRFCTYARVITHTHTHIRQPRVSSSSSSSNSNNNNNNCGALATFGAALRVYTSIQYFTHKLCACFCFPIRVRHYTASCLQYDCSRSQSAAAAAAAAKACGQKNSCPAKREDDTRMRVGRKYTGPARISDKRFEQFRSEIVELFPLEPQLAYYERGAYLNKRQIFGKKAGLLDFKESDEKSQSEPKEDTVPRVTVTTTNIDCLLNVIKPDDDLSFIKNTWYSHYELRQRRYADLGFDLINTFKVLQHNICIELIDFDFNQKYKSDNLVQIKERWYGIVEAIIEIAAEKLITHTTRRDETECAFLDPEQFPYCLNKVRNKDHDKSIKTVLAVFCLPWIVDYSVRRTQVFVDWKPSACDKLNSFCLQILDHSNLDAIVTSTAENYEACGVKSPQPYVVCCGTIPNPEVLKIIFDLHKNVRFTRSDIDDIILTFSSFISYHNKLMFSQLESLLKNANDAILHEISKVFDRYKNPFELVKTCDARENLLIRLNIYKEPVEIPIATENFYKLNGTEVTTIEKPVKIVHIPLEDSLTTLLQIDGLFEAIVDYIDYLDELNVLTNFMQGDLWKKKSKHMKDENKLVLPLAFYSDDVELGNALGSHAGVNKLGANYLFLLCLPPNIASKLWSIILCDLYYAKYRKSYGNEKVFEHSIKELNRLRDKGIRVKTKSGIHHVYFLTSIISGDNLGLNGMLGFIESFYNTVFCRVCYSFPIIVSKLTKENSKLLRTVEKYEEDVKSIKTTSSGIKEPCVFNKLKDFHVIDNQSLDIMHDLYEGVCSITMANIILTLILEDELFSIDFLNARLQSIDFSFESKNVPQNISLDYLKNNGHLKMSASECLFFTRYFGIMVGFKVKEDNCAWALYLELREMVDLLTAPRLTESHLAQLETIIPNFLSSYIDLYGDLKGKFHLLIHYPRIIRANGPPTKVSTIRCESKHKVLKSIAPNASNKNTLFSVAKRYQLSVMYLKHEKYDENGITYDDDLYFEYIPLKTLGFNDHIYAYERAKADELSAKVCIVLIYAHGRARARSSQQQPHVTQQQQQQQQQP
uniref:Uncharacterized protein n=1 Tax=Trichogramma kaykai TaxID=54128 RepID=A0ABD2X7M5_9HYME